MKRFITLLTFLIARVLFSQEVDTRILNIGYWEKMASLGLVERQEFIKPEPASFTGSTILREKVLEFDSPDIAITEGDTVTQSENSVFVNPLNYKKVLNSNNSTYWIDNIGYAPFAYGADGFVSGDGGESWQGQVEGTGGDNNGDPAVVIDKNGRYYVGYIAGDWGQGVAYSDDEGHS